MKKATVDEIRARFDADVARFSNLELGQSSTMDAPLVLELIAAAAAATNPQATSLLDIGCGAGNYTLKLLQHLPHLNVTLVDLSQPMLDKAAERIRAVSAAEIVAHQADIRDLALAAEQYDIVLAAAVFHHLRDAAEWRAVFAKLYRALKPGGSLWISDLVEHSIPAIQKLMFARYGAYLAELRDEGYRDFVFDYIEKEDSPRPLLFQIDLLRAVGFAEVEVLHKNTNFAAFGARKQG